MSNRADAENPTNAPPPQRATYRSIGKSSWSFVIASLVSGLLGLAYVRLFGSRLNEDTRGALRALFAALAGYAFVTSGVLVAFVTQLLPPLKGATQSSLRTAAIAISLSSGAIALTAGLLWLPAHSDALLVSAATATYVALSGYASLPRAYLLSRRRWGALAAAMLVSAAVKFASAVVTTDDNTIAPMLLGLVIAEAAGCLLAMWFARGSARAGRPHVAKGLDRRLMTIAVSGLCGIWVLSSFDNVIARLRMSPTDADSYAVSAATARLVFVVPSILCWLALPHFLEGEYGSPPLRQAFRRASTAVVAVSAAAVTILFIAPAKVGRIMTDGADTTSAHTTRLLALSWAFFGFSALLVFFHIAHKSRMAIAPWAGVVIISIGARSFGDSPAALSALVLVASAVTTGLLLIPVVPRLQPVTHAIRAPSDRAEDGSIARHDVSIVIPCYNPGPVVLETVYRLAEVLAPVTSSFQVVAVSDGSTDTSTELLDGLVEPWFRHVHYDVNRGKGYALRQGFSIGHSSVVGFIDADGDLPPEQLVGYLRALDELGADAVLGSKRHPESRLEVPALRRVFSWGYQRIVRVFFRLDILDTQTGIKLFRRELIDAVLPVVREDGFALDLEIFVAARAAGFDRFVEMPVVLRHQYNSTVSNRTAGRMLIATGRIFWAARLSLRYARLIVPLPGAPWRQQSTDRAHPS